MHVHMSCVRTKYILQLKHLQAKFATIFNGMTCGMDSVMQHRILFPNFSTLTEKDSMGKQVGNTLFPTVQQSCFYSNDMNIKQDARREWHSNILINHLKHMKQKQCRP